MAYLSGQSGSILVGVSTYCVENWSLNVNTEALDVTTTCSGGWEENIAGISMAEGSAKAFWDAAAMPTSAPYVIRPGAAGTLTLIIGSSAKTFVVPCRITSIAVENAAKGVVTFSFNFKSNGAITYPA